MADSLDTILQSFRDLSSGAATAGQGFAQAGALKQKNDEATRKQEAERVKNERLQALGVQATPIIEKAKNNPDYGLRDFATDADPFVQDAIKSGDQNSLQALAPLRAIAEANDKAKADAAKAKEDRSTKGSAKADKEAERFADAAQKAGDKLTSETTTLKEALGAAQDAGNLLEMAKSNPSAAGASVRRLARAAGDKGVLSDKDAEAFGGSQAIADRLNRAFVTATSGTLDPKDAEYLQSVASKIQEVNQGRYDAAVKNGVSRFTKNYGGKFEDNYLHLTGEAAPDPKADKAKADAAAQKKADIEAKPLASQESQPALKVIDTDAADRIRSQPDIQQKFQTVMQRLTQSNAAKNLPPPSLNEVEPLVWRALGYQVVPVKK